jgi:hypothetical protein
MPARVYFANPVLWQIPLASYIPNPGNSSRWLQVIAGFMTAINIWDVTIVPLKEFTPGL